MLASASTCAFLLPILNFSQVTVSFKSWWDFPFMNDCELTLLFSLFQTFFQRLILLAPHLRISLSLSMSSEFRHKNLTLGGSFSTSKGNCCNIFSHQVLIDLSSPHSSKTCENPWHLLLKYILLEIPRDVSVFFTETWLTQYIPSGNKINLHLNLIVELHLSIKRFLKSTFK